jgi:hypothetical protein
VTELSRHTYIVARTAELQRCVRVAVFLLFAALPVAGAAQHQLSLSPIDLLPNSPTPYLMREWNEVALDFDALAFDTMATGQFLPIPRRDDTPESPHLDVVYELPSYVGDARAYGNGEPFAEGIPTLGAVLGSTLMGIDKSAGPLNWVSMTREFYIDRNNEFIMMNRTDSASGHSAWYDIFPNILFYSIADRYPDEPYLDEIQNQIDSRFFLAVNRMTAGGTNPNFNYSAYDFSDNLPRFNGTWREPDMGLGMAWMQHAAYWRTRQTNTSVAALHLQAVDWALAYYQDRTANPKYEILTSFGAYAAARMNAEHGRNYNVPKFLSWVFARSAARPDLIMISGELWGGNDVGGLLGGFRANSAYHPDDVQEGYAFAMNTYANAMPVVPIARYEDRLSRAIGKWMLNAANAARLFYGNAHPPQNQSSEFWAGDPQHSIAYEGLRHNWLPPHLLAPGESEEIYAAGDPLTYGWGPLTDWGIYGSAFTGVFGSIVKTTNIEKILQLDLLATDFYRDAAHQTFLYFNPHPTDQSVAIDLGGGQLFDLYDAVSNRFLKRSVTGQTFFDVPTDNTVMLVLVPSGGTEMMVGRKLLVDDVVVDYNAALLPDNLVRNPDVDSPTVGGSSSPAFWHRSAGATWTDDVALSPMHSLKLGDSSATTTEEWRSYATAIPDGEDRTIDLRWFWKYDIAPGDEFRARLRLSTDEAVGADLTNPSMEYDFLVSGATEAFEMFQSSLAIPDAIRSFDLTFITAGAVSAMGLLHIDDISLALGKAISLPGDYNADGIVDAADYTVWRDTFGSTGVELPADGNGDGSVTQLDYEIWKSHFGDTSIGFDSGRDSTAPVPEPRSCLMLTTALAFVLAVRFSSRPTGFRQMRNP